MKRSAISGLTAGLVLFVGALCGIPRSAQAESMVQGKQTPINHITADQCKECHEQIYKQWQGSMHAKSSALKDPIHGTFYRKVGGDPNLEGSKINDKYPSCLQCHAPNAATDGKTKLDSVAAYQEGVNCVACHRIKSFKGVHTKDGKLRLGMLAYEVGDTLSGPSGVLKEQADGIDKIPGVDDKGNPHLAQVKGAYFPLEGKNRLLRTSEACLGCHDQRNNSKDVPLCQTGNEMVAGKSKVVCQNCHMSNTNGLADHGMGGGHDMGMLKRAIILAVNTTVKNDAIKAVISMENLQPHSMPTGAPFRNIFIKVSALDGNGRVVWENAKEHPMDSDPKAYLHLVLVDAAGKPASPDNATGKGDDNRLKPFEKRDLVYTIPAKDVKVVRAEAFYNLLWPELNKMMEKALPADLRQAKRFAHAEAKL